jgi:hypothetical protein
MHLLSRSERAHLAYQALSRDACRKNEIDQAKPMKGYVVEIDPEIEAEVSKVMPGATWHVWRPYFMPETDTVFSTWKRRVEKYWTELPTEVEWVSSRSPKKTLRAEKVRPSTWKRVIRSVMEKGLALQDILEHGPFWRLEESSLVRVTASSYGSQAEVA